MNMINCIIETEQDPALADDPLWRGPNMAAMAPINCKPRPCVEDEYYRLDRFDALAERAASSLLAIPASRGLRWLNLGGWFSKPATNVIHWDDDKHTPQPYNPDPKFWTSVSERIVYVLMSRVGPSAVDGVFIDDEGGFIKADGTPEMYEQANRMAWLRRVTSPFVAAFGCKRVNYACCDPKRGLDTKAWWGAPLPSGAMDGISSVDCYSDETHPNKTWSWKRRNVAACLARGETVSHHPPAIWNSAKKQVATPEQAAEDLYAAILADSARGVTTHFCAAYAWKSPLDPNVNHWPLMAATIKRALAMANRLR